MGWSTTTSTTSYLSFAMASSGGSGNTTTPSTSGTFSCMGQRFREESRSDGRRVRAASRLDLGSHLAIRNHAIVPMRIHRHIGTGDPLEQAKPGLCRIDDVLDVERLRASER